MTLLGLLEYIYLAGGFTTRSDMAREHAEMVAYAAQLGYITTLTPSDGFGNVWRLSMRGFKHLWDNTNEERSLVCLTLAS